jgi:hypothetical protein
MYTVLTKTFSYNGIIGTKCAGKTILFGVVLIALRMPFILKKPFKVEHGHLLQNKTMLLEAETLIHH